MSKPIKIILGIVLVIVIALIAAGNYFYSYAVVPAKKDSWRRVQIKNRRN